MNTPLKFPGSIIALGGKKWVRNGLLVVMVLAVLLNGGCSDTDRLKCFVEFV